MSTIFRSSPMFDTFEIVRASDDRATVRGNITPAGPRTEKEIEDADVAAFQAFTEEQALAAIIAANYEMGVYSEDHQEKGIA